jgi:hypothetical protein
VNEKAGRCIEDGENDCFCFFSHEKSYFLTFYLANYFSMYRGPIAPKRSFSDTISYYKQTVPQQLFFRRFKKMLTKKNFSILENVEQKFYFVILKNVDQKFLIR